MVRRLGPVFPAILALAAALPAQRFEDRELYAPGGQKYERFGSAVALDGQWGAVGHERDADLGPESGSVWVFGVDPTATGVWQLTASDGRSGDRFGCSLAAAGGVLVAGAWSADAPQVDSGAAYVFRWDPLAGAWNEEAKLDPAASVRGDRTGEAVAVSAEVVVVGAPGNDYSGAGAGLAYAWRWDPLAGSWVYEGWLWPGAGALDPDDSFGSAVAVSGDVAAIGAFGDDDLGSAAGAVWVFRFVPGFNYWSLETKLTAGGGAAGDLFGWSLALDGDTLAVGAPGANGRTGEVFVFRYDPVNRIWNQEAVLVDPAGAADDQFGRSVALSGDLLAAGAPGADEGGQDHGTALWFERAPATGQWLEQGRVLDSSPKLSEQQGERIALLGDALLVAAPNDRDQALGAGSAALVRHLRMRLFPQPSPPVAGQPLVVDLVGAEPLSPAWLAYSLDGPGSYGVPQLGVALNLATPRQAGPMLVTDPVGNASWLFTVPAAMAGRQAWAQALQRGGKSERISVVIQ
ncbi:MAG: hypothetical protein D6702_00095 [Planctomycetota bacterium]|nr:MAG: hypothetical protein D6702_00095 [Planctomycetota bacterium]